MIKCLTQGLICLRWINTGIDQGAFRFAEFNMWLTNGVCSFYRGLTRVFCFSFRPGTVQWSMQRTLEWEAYDIYIYIHFVIRTFQLNIWKVIDHEFRGSIFKYSKLNHEYPIAKESIHSIDAQRNISGQWHTGFFILYLYLFKVELCPAWILIGIVCAWWELYYVYVCLLFLL